MIARITHRKLALLSAAATVLAACGADPATDVEVRGITVEEPGTALSATDDEGGTRDTAAEDGIPWHLLPDADRPTRGSIEQADCQGRPLEVVAC